MTGIHLNGDAWIAVIVFVAIVVTLVMSGRSSS